MYFDAQRLSKDQFASEILKNYPVTEAKCGTLFNLGSCTDKPDSYEAVTCPACARLHFVNKINPFFVEKLRDVVGIYLNPPDKAVVLCVDEKSQIQALERTQPLLPMGFGYIEGVTHDYQRHGTTTLFAALNVLDGAVIAQCKPRHRHQEFLAFLRHIETNVLAQLDIHLVVDNYATHKHPKVRAWLARRPRWHIHFTPTYASWLNQGERFFALITQRAIRRGYFVSTADLVQKIDRFIRNHNSNSQPFLWTHTGDSILQKLARLCQRITGTEH